MLFCNERGFNSCSMPSYCELLSSCSVLLEYYIAFIKYFLLGNSISCGANMLLSSIILHTKLAAAIHINSTTVVTVA